MSERTRVHHVKLHPLHREFWRVARELADVDKAAARQLMLDGIDRALTNGTLVEVRPGVLSAAVGGKAVRQ
jgi:hypothetical protein